MMSFLKIKSAQLFDGRRFRPEDVLVLRENGMVEDIIPASEAGENVRELNGIVCPGFINCHCHLELSHLKNKIEERTGLTRFVRDVVTKRNLEKEKILSAIDAAETEMITNGMVAVGDICNTTDTLPQKEKSNLYYHNFIEVIGSDPKKAENNFNTFQNVYNHFCNALPAKQISFSPHAPYSVSELLWEKILSHEKKIMTIHNQETPDENLWFQNKTGAFAALFNELKTDFSAFAATGKSSLQSYLTKFPTNQSLMLVHNVHTSEEDIRFAMQQQSLHLFWCFCVNANQYISAQIPDIPMFAENNCTIVLGTDSLASNHELSIWEEIKTIQTCFPQISLAQLLQWATFNGAAALQISDTFGSFEKGKNPGVVHINCEGQVKRVIGFEKY
jgi:cytosine/adenosine deaminase-related metal-dependent hydrolase